MANSPVFAQTPKAENINIIAANTALDGSGSITTLVTAGANGALVTHMHIISQATSVATGVRMFISFDGGAWEYIQSFLHAAFTVATTSAQTPTTIVDRNNPDAAIRLPANARLGFTEGVATNIRIYAEWMDF